MNETLFVFEGRPFTILEVAAGGGGLLLFLLLMLTVLVIAGQRRRARARRDLEEQLRFMAQAHGELTGRVRMLAELISEMRAVDGVWIAQCATIAEYVAQEIG